MSPKSKYPLGSLSATKSIAKTLTFYSRGGRQKVRKYHKPSGSPSAAQTAQRLVIKTKVEAWKDLSYEDKTTWNDAAKELGDPWTGYTFFMSTWEAVMEFTELSDTFASYIGHGGKHVRVNLAEDALEPVDLSVKLWCPDVLPAVPSDQDDQFDDGSLDPKWSEWDLGTPKLTVSESGSHLILTHATENAARHRGVYQTLPAGDFSIAAKLSGIASASADSEICLALFENAGSSSGDVLLFILFQRASGNKYRDIFVQKWSDYSTFSLNYAGGTIYPGTTVYFRIRRSGTTLYYDYGFDGVSWQMLYTHSQPFTPSHMGVVSANNNSGLTTYGYFDVFRYIASNQIGPLGRLCEFALLS